MEKYEFKEAEVRLKLSEGRTLYSIVPLKSPDVAVDTMSSLLKELDHEVACVVNLDIKARPINFSVIGVGGQRDCNVPISSIFKAALLSGAGAIMILHNHPSGDVTASEDDLRITKRIIMAGQLMEIPLLDHIIIGAGDGNWSSIRNNHPEIDFFEVPRALADVIEVKKNDFKRKGR